MQSLHSLEILRLAKKSKQIPAVECCKMPNCNDALSPGMAVCERHKLEAGKQFYAQIGLDPLFHMQHSVTTFSDWCWTYFMGSREHGIVKIGRTSELKSRMMNLRNSSPVPVKLFAVVYGGYEIEPFLHERFKAARKHGEWFEITSEIDDCINSIKAHKFGRYIPESMIPATEERIARATKAMTDSLLVDPMMELIRAGSAVMRGASEESISSVREGIDRLRDK